MEAAVSAYAVSSKWCLGLGRQRGVVGSRKQSLLLLSIDDGVGYTRKMKMMRRFRLESSWMGPRAIAIERQRFKVEAAASGRRRRKSSAQGGGDVENTVIPAMASSVLPYVGVACLGIGAVMLVIGYHLGYLLSSNTTTGVTSTTVAARLLVVAANIIGTTIASSFLDMLGCKGLLPTSSSGMINCTGDDYLLLNAKSSDGVDTFARVVALKNAGIPPEKAQVLCEQTKINFTCDDYLLLNAKISNDVDTFARVVALKIAGIPPAKTQVLGEETKVDKLLRTTCLDQQHKKETKAWWLKENLKLSNGNGVPCEIPNPNPLWLHQEAMGIHRVFCPAIVPGRAIGPNSLPETVYGIKYFSRDQRRNRPPIKHTFLKKDDVERMKKERRLI
ncbi:hypothetical protein OROGR_022386 [Orobanche gracilis]